QARVLPGAATSVRRFERVRRVVRAVQLDEEPLDVPVHSTLPHLVGLDLDEGVVAAFGARPELHDAEGAGEGARPWRGRDLRETEVRKEPVRGGEHLCRRLVAAIEVPHRLALRVDGYGVAGRSLRTSCIHSIFSSGCSESRRKRMPTAHVPDVT